MIFKLIAKNKTGIYNVSGSTRISKYNFGLELGKIFNLDKKLIKKISINKLNLVKRPRDMSLSNKKLIKNLDIKEDYFSLNKQLKRMKKDKLLKWNNLI